MISNPSIVKRAYDGLALFALLNTAALGAFAAYIAAARVIDGQKLRRIVSVIRGEEPESKEGSEVSQPLAEPIEPIARRVGGDKLAESQRDLEILRREAERIKTELDQRLALNNSILLKVMTERERFRQEQEQAKVLEEQSAERRRKEGFRKQIAIYDALSPKIALQHLLGIQDPQEAAEILLAMNTRKARSVIEAAKRHEDLEKMRTILQWMRERAPQRSAELGTLEP